MNKFLLNTIWLYFLFYSPFIFGENPDTTISKISARKQLIKTACKDFQVDPMVLSAIIYVERTQNFSWEDNALDDYLAYAGLNSSIGFCQVKLKTAYWIECQLNDTNSIFFPGKLFYNKMNKSKSTKELVDKLNDDQMNIRYAAAFLRIINSRWEKEGFPVNNRPEILGTLYSTGLFYSTGEERKPNPCPKSNEFGFKILEIINILEEKVDYN